MHVCILTARAFEHQVHLWSIEHGQIKLTLSKHHPFQTYATMPSSRLPPLLPSLFQLPARVWKVRHVAKSDKNGDHNLGMKKRKKAEET